MTFRLPIAKLGQAACRPTVWTPVLSLALLLGCCIGLRAEEPTQQLEDLSLEDLMKVRVTSVERRELGLRRTASAVYVITREQIERSNAANVPELLRRVPGVQVAQIDANKWAIGGRGSNSRYANKILVLVDGRNILNHLAGGVYWEHNDLMLEDIERIEVIRGPGATVWGVNAVNGVINIITRKAADTLGGIVSARTATTQPVAASARYGDKINEDAEYRVYAKRLHAGPSNDIDGNRVPDLWRTSRAGGRMDWRPKPGDTIRVQGDGFAGRFQGSIAGYPKQFLAILPFKIPELLEEGNYAGGYGLLRWDHTIGDTSSLAVQTSYQQEHRNELLGLSKAGAMDTTVLWNGRTNRQDLTVGSNFRLDHDTIQPGVGTYRPPQWSGLSSSAFLQSDISLQENLVLTLGSKFLHGPYDGFHIQPSARILWDLNAHQSLWAALSRSARPPTRRERDLEVKLESPHPLLPNIQLLGNPAFRSEKLFSAEAGYRRSFKHLHLDLASYYGHIGDNSNALYLPLQRLASGRYLLPVTFDNGAHTTSFGIEFNADWQVSERWNMLLSYTYAERFSESTVKPEAPRTRVGVPRHQGSLLSDVKLTPRLSWNQSFYYVGKLAGGLDIPSYHRLDTALSFRFNRQWHLSVGGENLLQPSHLEMASEDTTISRYVRRGAFLRLTWTQ